MTLSDYNAVSVTAHISNFNSNRLLLPEIFGHIDSLFFKNADFQPIFAYNALAVTHSEKKI